MTTQSIGPRFELLVNGKSLAVIGIPDNGVLSVHVQWSRRDGKRIRQEIQEAPDFNLEHWLAEYMYLTAGALDSPEKLHYDWETTDIQARDEICVRVLPPGEFDKPSRVRKPNPIPFPPCVWKRFPKPLDVFRPYGPSPLNDASKICLTRNSSTIVDLPH